MTNDSVRPPLDFTQQNIRLGSPEHNEKVCQQLNQSLAEGLIDSAL